MARRRSTASAGRGGLRLDVDAAMADERSKFAWARDLGTPVCVTAGKRHTGRVQLSLLGHEEPHFDAGFGGMQRLELGRGAWLDHAPGFLTGHASVFEELCRTTAFRSVQDVMYDRVVVVPRLIALVPDDGPGHPVLEQLRAALSKRYGELFTRVTLALYRDGRDSVAWHGDRIARKLDRALVATLSLGCPRRFLVRPHGGGVSRAFALGFGDLLVMGGSCQRTFQHCIPKTQQPGTRIAVMFRPAWVDPDAP